MKIPFRYFEECQLLRNYFNVRLDSFDETTIPVTVASNLIKSIKKFFEENLYNTSEIKLLLNEVMPVANSYGGSAIYHLEERSKVILENPDINSQHLDIPPQYEKIILKILATREILNLELNNYYKTLFSHENDSVKDKSVNDFFESILNSTITQIEIYNTVEKVSNNFDLKKLKILLYDFDLFLNMAREKKEGEYTDDDIANQIERLKKSNKEIPYLNISEADKNLFKLKESKYDNVIDLEKLLFPYDFFSCYLFRSFLEDEIKERKKPALSENGMTENIKTFDDLPKIKQDFLLQMLEDLGITNNGQSQLGPRGAHQIRAVVEAAIEKEILPPKRILFLTKLIGAKINHPVSKINKSKNFEDIKRRYIAYITSHPVQ